MSFESAEKEAERREAARRASVAKGYEREIRWDGEKGYIDSPPTEAEPDQALWDMVIEDWGLDPNLTEIVDGSVHIRAWDTNIGNGEIAKMRYYRAQIRRRGEKGDRADIEALCKEIMKRPAVKKPKKKATKDARAFMAFFSDWQIGKSEGGGSEATAARIITSQDESIERIRELITIGRAPSVIYCCGMGDLVENCSNHYAMQTFSVDLDSREQQKVARRLILRFVELCVENFPEIPLVVAAVPGNHGENRLNGKAYTTWTDNMDLAVFEGVAEICAANPSRFGNVSFPQFEGLIEEDLTMTLNVCGKLVTLAHGHQFGKGSGGGTIAKIESWILGQIRGRTKAAESDIYVSGHFHHYIASEGTGRTCFQCPAQDGGSKWFTDTSGKGSPAGMLTFCVGDAYGKRGWGDLLII